MLPQYDTFRGKLRVSACRGHLGKTYFHKNRLDPMTRLERKIGRALSRNKTNPNCVLCLFNVLKIRYRCLFVSVCFYLFTHELLVLLQNALAKATVKELATLHGTKYTYGPGATTICESWLQNCATRPHA